MVRGRPLSRHGKLVRVFPATKPKRSPGARRTWTLRVVRIVQRVGGSYPAGARETLLVAWRATPRAIAAKPGARLVLAPSRAGTQPMARPGFISLSGRRSD
jgi:hypothetical protein